MKELFEKNELSYFSLNFILSLPEQKMIAQNAVSNQELINEQTFASELHQNQHKIMLGGYYKSITRIIK